MCATLYRAVTGKTPVPSIERMRQDTLMAPSAFGADISPVQEEAIMVGLSLDPDRRLRNMVALENALYAGMGTEKQPDSNTGGGNTAIKIVIIAMLVILAALIAVIALFAAKGRKPPEIEPNDTFTQTQTYNVPATAAPTEIPAPVFERVSASSTRGADTTSGKTIEYYIDYINDGDYTTAWSSDRDIEITPTITFSSDQKQHVSGIKIANGYFKSEETYKKNRRITKILITYEGGSKEASLNTDSYRIMQDVKLDTPVDTAFLSVKVLESLSGTWKDIAISELSIY
jgi:hypothetical protein